MVVGLLLACVQELGCNGVKAERREATRRRNGLVWWGRGSAPGI
jgi:hypothetical protein